MITVTCIVILVARMLNYPVHVGLSVAIALSQIGEFSFILGSLGKELKILRFCFRFNSRDDEFEIRPPPSGTFIVVFSRWIVGPISFVNRNEFRGAEHLDRWETGYQFLQDFDSKRNDLRIVGRNDP